MSKPETKTKLNELEKENRKSRLEEKLLQNYYGNLEEILDPLSKSLFAKLYKQTELGENTTSFT